MHATTTPITQTDRWGGYRFTSVKTMDGREGEAYSANITLTDANGRTRTIGDSRNDGNGGSDFRFFRNHADQKPFNDHAMALYGEDNFEVGDRLASDLVTVTMFNRKRKIMFTTKEQGDFWSWDNPNVGQYSMLTGPANNIPAAVDYLKKNFPGSSIWSKDRCDFIPVDSIDAANA